MILLIDNYDSFVYNLARYFGEMGCQTRVVRNDRITVDEVQQMKPAAIVLSPGPCTPREAGVSVKLVRELAGSVPMLGVCLGHQAIAAAFGAAIVRAPQPVHGRTSLIHHNGKQIFSGLINPLRAARYHSLMVDEQSLPDELKMTARCEDGIPMALEHRVRKLFGVQFHPESVLTQSGHQLLGNFLKLAGITFSKCPSGDFAVPPSDPDWPATMGASEQPLHW